MSGPNSPSTSQPSNLQTLLFGSIASNHQQLFENVADLGRRIARQPGTTYSGKGEIVSALLRQVMDGRRACPSELRQALEQAVRERLRELGPDEHMEVGEERWIEDLNAALKRADASREQGVATRNRLSKRLVQAMAAPGTRFAINLPTDEVQPTFTMGSRSSKVIADSLGLSDQDGVPASSYVIGYQLEQEALGFYLMLFQEITGRNQELDSGSLDPEAAIHRLERAEKDGRLIVYRLPYYLCLTSVVLYNPERYDSMGILLVPAKPGRTSLVEIPKYSIPHWRRLYIDVEKGIFPEQERLSVSEFKHILLK